MTGVVLDASAILALINAEPGADRVGELLEQAIVSAVNHAEVMTKLIERGMDGALAKSTILKIGLEIVDYGIDLADRTGELRRHTQHLGLSLADRACLALAQHEGLPAVTADRKWAQVDIGVDIRLIR
ncbi:MAG: type II toxin-antitoxin system VapC family toxin [Pseudolabrys sp.]